MGKRLSSPDFLVQSGPLRSMGRLKERLDKWKVDKTDLAIPQAEPLRDRDYLDWGALLPCAICGATGECVMHHPKFRRNGGMAYRESDDRCCPLCPRHHTVGPEAVHSFKGHESDWWVFHGVDAELMGPWLREAYLADPADLDRAAHIIRSCGPKEGL